jgi:hypothetical protein
MSMGSLAELQVKLTKLNGFLVVVSFLWHSYESSRCSKIFRMITLLSGSHASAFVTDAYEDPTTDNKLPCACENIYLGIGEEC